MFYLKEVIYLLCVAFAEFSYVKVRSIHLGFRLNHSHSLSDQSYLSRSIIIYREDSGYPTMYYSLDHPSAVMQQVQYPSAPTKVLYHATATANIWGVLSRGLVLPWQVGCTDLLFVFGAFHDMSKIL